ncbi:MAG: Verru_Chthon cassette protein B [Verrucomicrobiaceae bacterium]|nr:MAG: Verru_Chthon cassette protein B [Verrucomicrobiaceae bacterium]
MKKSTSPSSSFFKGGFTLAEVMIAMGIVASVMVALLGMIPLGVRQVREATNLTISGRIAQEVISNIQQSNWKDIEQTFDAKTFKFDHEGFLIRADSKEQTGTYEARVTLTNSSTIKFGETEYPKDTLRKVLITVEYTPDGMKVVVRPNQYKEGNPNIQNYNFYVANQNKTR